MENFKLPYEISLWEEVSKTQDVYLQQTQISERDYEPGKYYSNIATAGSPIYALDYGVYENKIYYVPREDGASGDPKAIITYLDEEYICTIGSHNMTFLSRCINPKLSTKTNGENVLTFTMYYQYYDNETGELVYNPFIKYLTNERKVKLSVGEGADKKWYDFVVKQSQQNSDSKTFTFTCKDRFINELSKSGFELEFDNELENNMGTVDYLAREILKGSDWELAEVDNLKQYIEEPLYSIVLSEELRATDMETEEEVTVPSGKTIFVFYSHFNEKIEPFQFLYTTGKFSVNDNYVIDKNQHHNYISDTFCKYTEKPELANYRGMRLVRQIQTKYDATIDKFVQVYKNKNDGETYYGFTETEYLSPVLVENYIVNPNTFTSTSGWFTEKINGNSSILELVTNPPLENFDFNATFTSYLKFKNNNGYLVNSSISSFRSALKGFTEGQKYVLRFKFKAAPNGEKISPIEAKLCQYELKDDIYSIKTELFVFSSDSELSELEKEDGYTYLTANCLASVSKATLKDWSNRYGLFLKFNNEEVYIEDAQLFAYDVDNDGKLCIPGGNFEAQIRTTYKYYLPNSDYESIEDLEVAWEGTQPNEDFSVKYNEGINAYTKVSSITAKESNRFNLLQDLNEKFECWMKINVEREENGKIRVVNGRQQKFISFLEHYGQRNYAGFKYGINSKSIQRTIDSNSIISKMIVKDNANEFAKNGFCSISRASENLEKENFLLDFEYFWRHKLLDEAEVSKDLYVQFDGGPGYYQLLRRINNAKDQKIEQQANLVIEISKLSANFQTYKTSYDAAVEERLKTEEDIIKMITPSTLEGPLSFEDAVTTYGPQWKNDSKYIQLLTSWTRCKTVETQHYPLYTDAETTLAEKEAEFKTISKELEAFATQKRALNLQFYKKYSSFIQEGSWIKEDYVDDNLYYIDSLSTLRNSTQPKVTYTINVLDLSRIPEYAGYKFELGDITYIEDPEFFGWSLINKLVPYREEVVVNEITFELDAPEKTVIKVQNYKNQFADLFQRITAQTQQAEYHTGEYERASKVVNTDGTISVTALEDTFANNQFRLQSAKDQSVEINEFGITSTSSSNQNEKVRIVSGGIFLSSDGGRTWRTGITGQGISSSYLTAGQIDVDKIFIRSGSQPTFGWDKDGIKAFWYNDEIYDTHRYILFDKNGLSGVKNNENIFKLDWDGLVVNRTIINDQEEVVRETIKIGQLKDAYHKIGPGELVDGELCYVKMEDGTFHPEVYNTIIHQGQDVYRQLSSYGIRIKDYQGNTILETQEETGGLWLKDRLSIGSNENSSVQIGHLEGSRPVTGANGSTKIMSQVFYAGRQAEEEEDEQEFVIYEDGYFEARAGKIGDQTIGDINSVIRDSKRIEIRSNQGTEFKKDASGNITPSQLIVSLQSIGINLDGYAVDWEISGDFINWNNLAQNDMSCIITKETFSNYAINSVCYLRVKCSKEAETLFAYATFKLISDGEKGDKGDKGDTGDKGASLEVRYKNSATTPTIVNNDISGWLPTIPTPEADKSTYMTQKLSNETNWSTPIQISAEDGTTPTVTIVDGYWYINGEATNVKAEGETPQITIQNGNWFINGVDSGNKAQGDAGKDGASVEYVYYISAEEQTSLASPSYTSGVLTPGWTASPTGITEDNKYEYVSVRTKSAGVNTAWSNFSTPVIWSKWGDKGQDGDGVEYKYYLKNDSTAPTYSAGDTKWTDDPTGVSIDNQYEFVVQIKTVNETPTVSKASLWAKYGEDGRGIDYHVYLYGVSTSPDTRPKDFQSEVPTSNFNALNKYLWQKTITYYTDGTNDSANPKISIMAVYGDTGAGLEFQVYSPEGYQFSDEIQKITLQTALFENGNAIENGIVYTWFCWNEEQKQYEIIQGQKGSTLIVNLADEYALTSIKCVAKYNNIDCSDYVNLTQKITTYNAIAKVLDKTVYFNEQNDGFFVYVELYKDGQIAEELPTKNVYAGSFEYEGSNIKIKDQIAKELNERMYFITGDYTLELYECLELNSNPGQKWGPANIDLKYNYTIDDYTIDNKGSDFNQILRIPKSEISQILNLNFTISEGSNMITKTGITLFDYSDPSIGQNAPENPKEGQFWLDTSTTPPTLKVRSNYQWISSGTNTYVNKPDKYFENDLWIISSADIENLKLDSKKYSAGTMMRAKQYSDVFNIDHWVYADETAIKQQQNISQYFAFDQENGLKIGQVDQQYYVNISSTEMKFVVRGDNNKEVTAASFGYNSALVQNPLLNGSAIVNDDITFYEELKLGRKTTAKDGEEVKELNFIWQIEEDGGLSLASAKGSKEE